MSLFNQYMEAAVKQGKYLVHYDYKGAASSRRFKTEVEAKKFVESNQPKKYTIFRLGPQASDVNIQLDKDHYTVIDTNEPYYKKAAGK